MKTIFSKMKCPALRGVARLCFAALAVLFLGGVAPAALAETRGVDVAGGAGGRLHVVSTEENICAFAPLAADARWTFHRAKESGGGESRAFPFSIQIGAANKTVAGVLRLSAGGDAVNAAWEFTAKDDVAFETLAVAAEFGLRDLAGGSWQTDSRGGVFPKDFGGASLFGARTGKLAITFPDGRVMRFVFPRPTHVVLQDNRQWNGSHFSLRIGRGSGRMAARERFAIEMAVRFSGGARYCEGLPDFMKPVVLQAGDAWIPLAHELEIEPGSALDLSGQGFVEGPCGSKGRIIVTDDGHFACANEPGRPLRFYGVNLCFSAQFISKDEVDRLLDRLVRLGYNTVRIHHYEGGLSKPEWKPGFDWDGERLDQLDYLMAGCAKRGLWLTTDLYVSRPVSARQIGLEGKTIEKSLFKILVPVHEPAFQDWMTLARKFLDRVNPHTGIRLADDPALAWISLINEGPLSKNWAAIKEIPAWKTAWNRWLGRRYATREALDAALGGLSADEHPEKDGVALPGRLSGDDRRARVAQAFVAETELRTYERMRDFLRNELNCRALLTNMNNAGPSMVALHLARNAYDYVDEHFYVDHPQFLETPWRLPSRSPNANPIASGARGGLSPASVRLFGKPYTITEYNYSGPGRFRGVGGVLTGALGALQDWDGLWRFAYSHKRDTLFAPAAAGYFDLASDPLNQAADRLALFLYLRRDLASAPSRIEAVLPRADLRNPPGRLDLSALQSAAWITRIGSVIQDADAPLPPGVVGIPPVAARQNSALAAVLSTIQSKLPRADSDVVRSETGEITIDAGRAVLAIDTPKSAGGYANAGRAISSPAAGVEVDALTVGATVFVNSLDRSPIRSSRRLLVTHLTDLQNTGCRYAEGSLQTLLEWGKLPHLVRAGAARVRIRMDQPERFAVWGLSVGGRRTGRVKSTVENGWLVFNADVKGPEGARMLYEIAPDTPL